jgi:hypothetical protein
MRADDAVVVTSGVEPERQLIRSLTRKEGKAKGRSPGWAARRHGVCETSADAVAAGTEIAATARAAARVSVDASRLVIFVLRSLVVGVRAALDVVLSARALDMSPRERRLSVGRTERNTRGLEHARSGLDAAWNRIRNRVWTVYSTHIDVRIPNLERRSSSSACGGRLPWCHGSRLRAKPVDGGSGRSFAPGPRSAHRQPGSAGDDKDQACR